MNPTSYTPWLEFILAILAVAGAVIAIVRKTMDGLEHRINGQIEEYTKQIRTDANGGQSLMDLHKKMDEAIGLVTHVTASHLRMEGQITDLQDGLENHEHAA